MKYEFYCRNCKQFHEMVLPVVDYLNHVPVCPHCGSHEVARSFGTFNFVLKGTGWGRDKS